ncbi:MAG: SDR family oxidoreductase [Hyphomonadaceae bacterium]
MRVLVLGAYGLIGSEIVRRLRADGLTVVGFGRSAAKGRRLAPDIAWFGADLAALCRPAQWAPYLQDVDAVVNASGALQDGAIDRLSRSQQAAIIALIEACARSGPRRFVQISAPGAERGAGTAFMRTKAEADAALRASSLDWTILKPGLVISAYAYGGTALLRMLAAFPAVQLLAFPQAQMQTVAADDVAEAVAVALTTDRLARRDVDLVERAPHTLAAAVSAFRRWLGFGAPRFALAAPRLLSAAIGCCADAAGWLGWRSPLRTTALKVLAGNVLGDPDQGEAALGRPLRTMEQSLAALPSTMQERVFARAQLAFPLLAFSLALFWIASGVIALIHAEAAAGQLRDTALEEHAMPIVISGALLDIAVGAAVCVRKTARPAALAGVAVSLCYLGIGTWLAPQLWADPLGPFVKVIPAIALALAFACLIEER